MLAAPDPNPGAPTFPVAPVLVGPDTVYVGSPAAVTSRLWGQLCYQHGTSRVRCFKTGESWTIQVLSGRQQFFTLRIDGVVVARLVYQT